MACRWISMHVLAFDTVFLRTKHVFACVSILTRSLGRLVGSMVSGQSFMCVRRWYNDLHQRHNTQSHTRERKKESIPKEKRGERREREHHPENTRWRIAFFPIYVLSWVSLAWGMDRRITWQRSLAPLPGRRDERSGRVEETRDFQARALTLSVYLIQMVRARRTGRMRVRKKTVGWRVRM